jgi:hypothetical protein
VESHVCGARDTVITSLRSSSLHDRTAGDRTALAGTRARERIAPGSVSALSQQTDLALAPTSTCCLPLHFDDRPRLYASFEGMLESLVRSQRTVTGSRGRKASSSLHHAKSPPFVASAPSMQRSPEGYRAAPAVGLRASNPMSR